MTDKKLTDSEIVKALEGAYKIEPTTMFFITDYNTNKITTIGIGDIVDLINRQKAENENLKVELQSMRGAANSLKMHYEGAQAKIKRLKVNLNIELENFATEYDNKIKAEAYKEFAERLKKKINDKFNAVYNQAYPRATIKDIDNLLKELVGEDK